MDEAAQDWRNAAISASNLSEAELLVGDIAAAAATAEKSVALADRSGESFRMMRDRTTQADALRAHGDREEAEGLFEDAERRQRERQPQYPLLYSFQGYRYCDLVLSHGRAAEARDRAARTLEWARRRNWVLDIALDTTTLGRADLALALQSLGSGRSAETTCAEARTSAARLEDAVEGLRASGESAWVVRGLLARAAFRRAVGDWDGAARDLDEVAGDRRAGADAALSLRSRRSNARGSLWRGAKASRRSNGLVEPRPPPPALPDAAAAAELREEARNDLDVACKLIRRVRLSPARRGAQRARRRRRRPPPVRRSAAARVRLLPNARLRFSFAGPQNEPEPDLAPSRSGEREAHRQGSHCVGRPVLSVAPRASGTRPERRREEEAGQGDGTNFFGSPLAKKSEYDLYCRVGQNRRCAGRGAVCRQGEELRRNFLFFSL